MKKSRILLLVSALLVLAMMLSSCGNAVSGVGKYLNEAYDPSVDVYAQANDLAELEGYSINESILNDDFVVFSLIDPDPAAAKITYKLLSMHTGKVVATFVAGADDHYEFLQSDNMVTPYIIVKRTYLDSTSINLTPPATDFALVALAEAAMAFRSNTALTPEHLTVLDDYITTTYELYDPAGTAVTTTKYQPEWPITFADYVVYDDVAYTIDEDTGAWTKEKDIPEYVALDDYLTYNDEYYYTDDDGILTVYDHDFKVVSTYVAPAYGDESIKDAAELVGEYYGGAPFKVLNNGDILYQYAVIQDEDEKKYDLSYVVDGVTTKANLVSLLISAKKGEAKELDLDYIVFYSMANNMVYSDELEANENIYNQEFENIAYIAPIEDGKVHASEADIDIVLMNNKAKAGKSLKMVDGQAAAIPFKVSDDLYAVYMLDGGIALINAKGDVLNRLNNYLDQVGKYFIGEDAIYNLSLEKVQDLKDPDVSYKVFGESIFVTKKTDSKTFTVELLLNGETTTVYSQDKDSKTTFGFGVKKSALTGSIEDYGYYYVKNEAGDYTYYNEKGTALLTTTRYLVPTDCASESVHTLVLVGMPADPLTQKVVYYSFTK